MAELIGFPARRHPAEAVRAEWELARAGCERLAGLPVMGNEWRMIEAMGRELAARERLMVVAGRV